jgi:hypothetical protein
VTLAVCRFGRLPDLEFDPEVFDQLLRKGQDRDAELLALWLGDIVLSIGVVSSKFATGQNFESLGAEAEFLIHAFIVGAREKGYADFEKNLACRGCGTAFPKSLAANTVGTARALFEHGRVPGEVVMHHMSAMAVEIDFFLADRRAT